MTENIKVRWLTDNEQTKVAPKTLITQVLNEDGTRFKDSYETSMINISEVITTLNETIKDKADKVDIINADWNQTDETALDYIKNKPTVEQIVQLFVEMDVVQPIADKNNVIYIDIDGQTFIL